MCRLEMVELVQRLERNYQYGNPKSALVELKSFIDKYATKMTPMSFLKSVSFRDNLLEDLRGQVTEAFSKKEY